MADDHRIIVFIMTYSHFDFLYNLTFSNEYIKLSTHKSNSETDAESIRVQRRGNITLSRHLADGRSVLGPISVMHQWQYIIAAIVAHVEHRIAQFHFSVIITPIYIYIYIYIYITVHAPRAHHQL